MKASRLFSYWILVFLLAMAASACSRQPNPIIDNEISSIRVVMDDNYPPYAFKNEKGEMQGIAVDQWRLWEERTNVKVEITGMAWEEAVSRMKQGEFDVIDTIFYTEERAQIYAFTPPYADINVRIFFPSGVSGIGNISSLQGFRVAVKTGDANAEYLMQNGVHDLRYYESYEAIIQAAKEKKETIFVIDQPPALYFLHKYGLQDQFYYSEPLYGGQFHRAVKKENTQLLALVNEGFASITASEYRKIDERWFGANQYTSLAWMLPYAGVLAASVTLVVAALALFNRILQTRVHIRTRELEHALADLKASENRFRELLEFLPIPIGIADDKGNVLNYNRKFIELYGYTPQDTPTIEAWKELAYPDPEYRRQVFEQWDKDVRRAAQSKAPTTPRQYKIIGKNGAPHDVEITMNIVDNLYLTAFTEITEQKRTEAALREQKNFLFDLIEHNEAIVIVKDAQGRFELVNHKYETVTGLKREQVIGRTAKEVYADPFGSYIHALDMETIQSGESAHSEDEIDAPSNTGKRYFLAVRFPLRDESGNIKGMCCISSEITERKQAEQLLRETETKYRALIEHAPEVIYLDKASDEGDNLFISPQVETLLGYPQKKFIEDPLFWHQIIHPEDYTRAVNSINNTIQYGQATEEYRIIKMDGSAVWVRDTSVCIYDENKKPVFIQGFLQDITERKIVEEKLMESEKRYRAFFENAPVALLEEDYSQVKKHIEDLKQQGVVNLRKYFQANPGELKRCAGMVRVLDANNEAMHWRKAKHKSEVIGNLSKLIPQNELGSLLEEIVALDENRTYYETTVYRHDTNGNPLHFYIKGIVAPNYESTWERVIVTVIDLTKLKQTEEALAQQIERLRALRNIDQVIISSFDLESNLNVLIGEIISQLKVDAASICLQKDGGIVFGAGKGFWMDAKDFVEARKHSGLAMRALQENKNIYIRNLQEADYPEISASAAAKENFFSYYGVPLRFKDNLLGILEVYQRAILPKDEDWTSFLEILAGQAAIAINSAQLFQTIQASNENLKNAYDATLEGWSRALDLRDKETEGLTRRVTELTLRLAQRLNLPEEQLIHIKRGAILHDIGKMGIPDAILLKPGALTEEEWKIMRKHPVYAYEMLSPIQYLQPALEIPLCHHEWWDGSGYPKGLKGAEIPFAARIFAVVDVWDALTSNRPYRSAWTKQKTIEYLQAGRDRQFDPQVLDSFLEMLADE